MKKTLTFFLLFSLLLVIIGCRQTDSNAKTDNQKVNLAKAELNILFNGNDTSISVTKNIELINKIDEVNIVWESSHDWIINNLGEVTRPNNVDTKVTLTAILTLNEAIETKTFILTVKMIEEEYDINTRTALNENERKYETILKDTYKNPIQIDGQWGGIPENAYAYGIGDPFIMRFNGKYYLYPSTQDNITGVKVFESVDLINWEYKGYAVSQAEESSRGAYAPEVIYYDGYFYLTQSKGGSGHYFYKADNPLGPFHRITGNLGRGIDGSFHIMDDGSIYLLHTGIPAALRMTQILNFPDTLNESDTGILAPQKIMESANLNHWIEGPGIIRRNDISYLTYAGNHVISKGYRIAYSYTNGNLFENDDFTQPPNNVTLISTKDDYSGLGHSSNAFGPNLDSIYTAYHNRDQFGRRYNLDQYLTNGVRLVSNGALNNFGEVPQRPDYEVYDFTGLDSNPVNMHLSNASTKDYFTAEFNYLMNDGAVLINYKDNQNYLKINIDKIKNKIELIEIKNGNETTLQSNEILKNNNYNRLTELRIEKSLNHLRVFYNKMLKINIPYQSDGGKIGYIGNPEIYYTAFTNDIDGSSDFEVTHNLPSIIPAQGYLKKEDRGFHFYGDNLTNHPVRNGEPNNIKYLNQHYSVLLNEKEDYVKYSILGKNETYSLVAEITKESLGSIIELVVGEEDIIKVDVPSDITFPNDVDFLKVYLGEVPINGNTTIKVRLFKGEFEFRQLEFYEDGMQTPLENLNGSELLEQTNEVALGEYILVNDEISSSNNSITMGLLGNEGISNFIYTVDVARLSSSTNDGGIVFRTKNYSYHKDQPIQSFQGYYFKIQERAGTLYKYDYGSNTLATLALIDSNNQSLFTPKTFNTIKIVSYNNNLKIYINDKLYLDIDLKDQFMDGRVGFYSNNSDFAYKNVSYKPNNKN